MKQVTILLLLAVLACNQENTDQVKPFIPGMYVRKINTEFTVGYDTLIISRLNENNYKILKQASFQKIRSETLLPVERRVETWTALYNKDDQVLHELQKGKVISFLPRENVLMVASSKYRKINN